MSTEDVRAALENRQPVTPGEAEPPRTPGGDELAARVGEAAGQPLNDYGNGQRVVIHFGDDLMFVPRVGWFTWDGMRWEADPDMLSARRKAQDIAPLIGAEVDHLVLPDWEMEQIGREDELAARRAELEDLAVKERTADQRRELAEVRQKLDRISEAKERLKRMHDRRRTHAKNAGNSGPLKNMLGEAETALAVAVDALDAEPLWVNCLSGVLTARVVEEETGGMYPVRRAALALVPHERGQRLTKVMPVTHDLDAAAPLWERFLTRILPDVEIRLFLQRWFGVSMTAERLQHMVFLYGMGANGKSVLVDTLARVMGDYAATARIESLTGTNRRGGGDATPDLIPLIGARFVRTSEPDEGVKLQEGLIKEMTGGEPIMVRALHSDFVEVNPVFKLTMSGNHKPDIRGTDDGIWRRFLMVPFEEQIPEAERDPHLAEKLWAERDGIFAWLRDGLAMYLEQGLAPPASVMEATAAFRAEQDPVGDFLTTCCWVSGEPDQSIPAKDLNEAFRYWQMSNGTGAWTESTVSRRLSDKAEKWRHPKTGRTFSKRKASVMMFSGIDLTGTWRATYEAAERDARGNLRAPSSAAAPDPPSLPWRSVLRFFSTTWQGGSWRFCLPRFFRFLPGLPHRKMVNP